MKHVVTSYKLCGAKEVATLLRKLLHTQVDLIEDGSMYEFAKDKGLSVVQLSRNPVDSVVERLLLLRKDPQSILSAFAKQQEIEDDLVLFNLFLEAKTAWLEQALCDWRTASRVFVSPRVCRINLDKTGLDGNVILTALAKHFNCTSGAVSYVRETAEDLFSSLVQPKFSHFLDNPAIHKIKVISQ